jgi:hypothetical protein
MPQKEDLICNQVTILETMFTGFLSERKYKMSAKEFQTALKLFYEAEMKKWFNKIRDSGEKMERGLFIRKKIMELHNLTCSDSSLEEYYQAEKPKLQAAFKRTHCK